LKTNLTRRQFTLGASASMLSLAGLARHGGALAQDPTGTPADLVVLNPPGEEDEGAAAENVALGIMVEVLQDPAKLDEVTEQIGRDPAIVMFHSHWGNDSGIYNGDIMEIMAERDITPLITWEAWRPLYAGGLAVSEQPDFALRTILDGTHDAYIDTWVEGLASFGGPAIMRFGHEMNGDWYPWGIGVNGNTAADFIDTWKYLRQKFIDGGADNVRWAWTPIASEGTPIAAGFPGDEFVDYVGMSGFNWGETQQAWGTGTWQTFTEIFEPMYEELQELSERPIIIAEMASAEQGGDKAEWILDSLLRQLATNFPEVRAVVWFNIVKETDWRINSSPEALRAFVTAANNPFLGGTLE
jgi:hypothetical protein